jgi:hypothetical protein
MRISLSPTAEQQLLALMEYYDVESVTHMINVVLASHYKYRFPNPEEQHHAPQNKPNTKQAI